MRSGGLCTERMPLIRAQTTSTSHRGPGGDQGVPDRRPGPDRRLAAAVPVPGRLALRRRQGRRCTWSQVDKPAADLGRLVASTTSPSTSPTTTTRWPAREDRPAFPRHRHARHLGEADLRARPQRRDHRAQLERRAAAQARAATRCAGAPARALAGGRGRCFAQGAGFHGPGRAGRMPETVGPEAGRSAARPGASGSGTAHHWVQDALVGLAADRLVEHVDGQRVLRVGQQLCSRPSSLKPAAVTWRLHRRRCRCGAGCRSRSCPCPGRPRWSTMT